MLAVGLVRGFGEGSIECRAILRLDRGEHPRQDGGLERREPLGVLGPDDREAPLHRPHAARVERSERPVATARGVSTAPPRVADEHHEVGGAGKTRGDLLRRELVGHAHY